MLTGIKSWHNKNISMCRTMEKYEMLKTNNEIYWRVGRDRTARDSRRKIKEMPVGCLKGNSGETGPPENPSDAMRGLEKKCQSGVHKNSGVIDRLRTRGTPRRGLK